MSQEYHYNIFFFLFRIFEEEHHWRGHGQFHGLLVMNCVAAILIMNLLNDLRLNGQSLGLVVKNYVAAI